MFLIQVLIPVMALEGLVKKAPFCPIVPFSLDTAFEVSLVTLNAKSEEVGVKSE